jgi:hypothetical protein
MSLDLVIGLIGIVVTVLVVVAMILITPRGAEASGPASDAEAVGTAQAAPTSAVG